MAIDYWNELCLLSCTNKNIQELAIGLAKSFIKDNIMDIFNKNKKIKLFYIGDGKAFFQTKDKKKGDVKTTSYYQDLHKNKNLCDSARTLLQFIKAFEHFQLHNSIDLSVHRVGKAVVLEELGDKSVPEFEVEH